jgi:Superinfection immunity protein
VSTTGWIVLLVILGVYFLPTIVAARHPNSSAIFVLNLLLGWTFIGWVIALVWAFTNSDQPHRIEMEYAVDDKALRQNLSRAQAAGSQRLIFCFGWTIVAIVVGSIGVGAWVYNPSTVTTAPITPTAPTTSTEPPAPQQLLRSGATTPVASDEVKNGANDWLLAQPNAARADMLGKVVGDKCKGKTAFYQGTIKSDSRASVDPRSKLPTLRGTENDTFWSIMCYDGRSFEVEMHPNGSGEVLECAALKATHAGECFKKF